MIGVCITVYQESAAGLQEVLEYGGYSVYVSQAPWQCFGIGPCLMRAWRIALEDGCDSIVQIDAGGSHDPREIDRFIAALDRGAEVVIGSRFFDGARYIGNPKRQMMSRFATWMCNLKTKGNFSDWTSGYRAFSRIALEKLLTKDYHSAMHFWQAEVLHYAWLSRMKILEVPITYTAGRSSFDRRAAIEAFRGWRSL